MSFKKNYLAFMLTLLSSSAMTAYASTNEDSNLTVLPTITVTASDESTANTYSRMDQSIKDTPQSVSIMSRARMDAQNITDLSTALDKMTGITMQQGSVFMDNFSSRGLEITNIRIDGLNSAARLQDFSQFEQVEVLRGADGLFSGNGEPSATVNLIRKRPKKEYETNLSLSAGSWDNYRASLDVTGPLAQEGALRGRFVATWNDQDFFYAVAEKNREMLYGIIEYDLASSTSIFAGISYDKLQGKQDWIGLPRYINGEDIGFSRKTSFVANWSNIEAESTQYFAGLNHQFNDDWKLKINVAQENVLKLNEYSRLGSGAVNPYTNTGSIAFIKNGQEPDSWTADINVQGKFNLFNLKHSVLFGVDYQDQKEPFYYMADRLPKYESFNVFEYDPNLFYYPSHAYAPLRTTDVKQLGFYGTLGLQLTEPLKLTLGGRLNNYQYTQAQFAHPTNPNNSGYTHYKDNNVFVPFAALSYEIDANWLVYSSLAETFKSQANYLDASGKPIDPITGRNYEIGLKGELWSGQATLSFAAYRTERQGEAREDNLNNSNSDLVTYTTAGETAITGFDTELTGQILPNLSASIGYSYQDKSKDPVNAFAWRNTTLPRHLFKLWLDYKVPQFDAWNIGMNVVAQSEQYSSGQTPTTYDQTTNTWGNPVNYKFSAPGRAVWGLNTGYQINPNLKANIQLNNIFDKTYWQTIGTTGGYNWYGEPRNVIFSLNATF